MLGVTLTALWQSQLQAQSVILRHFVNGYAWNDWILNYLSQATSGGLNSIAGFHPVQELDGERKAQQWTRERDLECGFGYGYSVGTNYSNNTVATER